MGPWSWKQSNVSICTSPTLAPEKPAAELCILCTKVGGLYALHLEENPAIQAYGPHNLNEALVPECETQNSSLQLVKPQV